MIAKLTYGGYTVFIGDYERGMVSQGAIILTPEDLPKYGFTRFPTLDELIVGITKKLYDNDDFEIILTVVDKSRNIIYTDPDNIRMFLEINHDLKPFFDRWFERGTM
jgi:hypothetical protein